MALVLLLACDGVDTPAPREETADTGEPADTDPADTADTADTGEPDAEYAALYDPHTVHAVALELSAGAISALEASPDEWVSGNLVIGDVRLDDVGVRLSGSSTWGEKPSFKVELDEFDGDLTYAGLDRLNLKSMGGDAAQGREVVALQVWQAAGLVAPRAGFADLTINGEAFGLYANVEAVDAFFVGRRWADPSGDLWQGEEGADLTLDGVENLDLVSGEGDTDALVAAWVAVQGETDDFYATADTVLQMDQFLEYWAWNLAVGNGESYPFELDDVYLYGDPGQGGRFAFVPWDLDESWESPAWDDVLGAVALKCDQDAACEARVVEAVDAALATLGGIDVAGIAQGCFAATDASVAADPRRPFTADEVATARAELLTAIAGWSEQVRAELP